MVHLRNVLRLNAVSCLVFGLIFVVNPYQSAAFLGPVPVDLLQVLGVLLCVNGIHLAFASMRQEPSVTEVLYFSAGDVVWFLGSVALVGANCFVTTVGGQVSTILVAIGVLSLGLAQIWLLAEIKSAGRPEHSAPEAVQNDFVPLKLGRAQAIIVSWVSMKRWIKIWLFALNGLFLAATMFLYDPAANLILAAYVASGALLASIVIWQRGLTRLLGFGHLLPWLPLVAYLGLRLGTEAAGPRISPDVSPVLFGYISTLLIALVVCLVLDAHDCWRWWRGERYRLGSKNAAIAGASARAAQ